MNNMSNELSRYSLSKELNEEYCLSTKIILSGELSLIVQHGPNYKTPYFILIKGDPAYKCVRVKMRKLGYVYCNGSCAGYMNLTQEEKQILNFKLAENSYQLWKFILYEQTLATMTKKDKDYRKMRALYYKLLYKIPDYTQLPE